MPRQAPAARRGPTCHIVLASALILFAAPLARSPAVAQEADLEAAKKQFLTSCGVCHTVEPGAPPRQGPNLHGVYGRKAASLPEFTYSDALKGVDWTWDDATLDPWIENAQSVRPGTVMNYRQADPAKRKLIIAYLKSLSTKP